MGMFYGFCPHNRSNVGITKIFLRGTIQVSNKLTKGKSLLFSQHLCKCVYDMCRLVNQVFIVDEILTRLQNNALFFYGILYTGTSFHLFNSYNDGGSAELGKPIM